MKQSQILDAADYVIEKSQRPLSDDELKAFKKELSFLRTALSYGTTYLALKPVSVKQK